MKFFQDSLENVAKSLELEDFKLTKNAFRDNEIEQSDNEEKLNRIAKKGIFPYSFDKFNETELPSKDQFFSD